MTQPDREQLAAMIDHAMLRPDGVSEDVGSACDLAARLGVGYVCVRPADVPLAASRLSSSSTVVGTVAGFPHGAHSTEVKVAEAIRAGEDGAEELDMVVHVGRLREGKGELVRADVAAVVQAFRPFGPVKVILECGYLEPEQVRLGCRATVEAGAAFVKTSTGFGPCGARVEDVKLMRSEVGPDFGVKAAGGIRTLEDALVMIDAGATRLGTSSTETILAAL